MPKCPPVSWAPAWALVSLINRDIEIESRELPWRVQVPSCGSLSLYYFSNANDVAIPLLRLALSKVGARRGRRVRIRIRRARGLVSIPVELAFRRAKRVESRQFASYDDSRATCADVVPSSGGVLAFARLAD